MKKALVVYKKSRYELYTDSPNEDVKRFLKGDDPDVKEMQKSHGEQENIGCSCE